MTTVPGPEEGRPLPDPEHSIAPRKPRTTGGVVYLVVLAATALALGLVMLDRWRTGLLLFGAALLCGAAARVVVPDADAGMLGIRRKAVDVLTLVVLGSGLVVLAVAIPDQPR